MLLTFFDWFTLVVFSGIFQLFLGLITLLVLAFWPAHENGPASFKSNKIVPKLYVFCSFNPTFYFQLQKRREMAVLDPLPMLNHEINKE